MRPVNSNYIFLSITFFCWIIDLIFHQTFSNLGLKRFAAWVYIRHLEIWSCWQNSSFGWAAEQLPNILKRYLTYWYIYLLRYWYNNNNNKVYTIMQLYLNKTPNFPYGRDPVIISYKERFHYNVNSAFYQC